MSIYENLGMIKGTKDQATATKTKYGTEWLVMEKDGKTYTWDHNGAVWRSTTMFNDNSHLVEAPKPQARPQPTKIQPPQYYTGNRRVGD